MSKMRLKLSYRKVTLIFLILLFGFLPATFIFAQKSTSDTIQMLQQQIAELKEKKRCQEQ